MGRTLLRFLLLNVLVAAVCSLVAVPILVALFDGTVGQGQDDIRQPESAVVAGPAVKGSRPWRDRCSGS